MGTTQIVSGIAVQIPIAMSGEQIYDTIMEKIEPELMSAQVDTLKEKYKNESAVEKKARGARYKKAYAEYDRQYQLFHDALHGKAKSVHREAMKSVEADERAKEQSQLQTIESDILSI